VHRTGHFCFLVDNDIEISENVIIYKATIVFMIRHWLGSFLLLFVSSNACQAQGRDTFDVLFPFNEARLSKDATEHIDELVFKDKLVHGQQFTILGYADYVGGDKYNEALSAKRAAHVKDYMVSMGFTPGDISICIGKGKISRVGSVGQDGVAADRKVQIIINTQQARLAAVPKPIQPAPNVNKPAVLDIAHIAVNETVTLKNILFLSSQAFILPTSVPELEDLYDLMRRNKTVKISIEGHTCCMGIAALKDTDDPDGKILSMERAKAVGTYLQKKGIAAERITYAGYGSTHPVAGSVTEEDQQKNRRVEIRITSK